MAKIEKKGGFLSKKSNKKGQKKFFSKKNAFFLRKSLEIQK